jgi:hypothetical protein
MIVRLLGRGWPSGRWRSGLRYIGGILGINITPVPVEGYFVNDYIQEGYVS